MGTTSKRTAPSGRAMILAAMFGLLGLLAAACGSDDDVTGPVDGLPEEVSSDTADESVDADDSASTDTTTPSTTSESTDTTTPEADPNSSITIVRFENDEHLQDEIDIELVERKMVEAVEAEDDNWLSCVMAPAECDLERDVHPMVGRSRQATRQGALDQYLELDGARYRLGPIDIRALVDVRVSNQTPVIGEVRVCEIDTGVVFIPGEDGGPEEVVNDDVTGVLHLYTVEQTEDGVLQVTARTTDRSEKGDTAFCDEYQQ